MKIFSLLDTQYDRFIGAAKNYLASQLSSFDTKYGNSTVFGQLLTVLSAAIQNVMLYIEDSLIEQNKYTAQRKKSIYGLATLSGYEPCLGKAASVLLRFTYVPNNYNTPHVIIKNHERLVCTQNGLQYNIVLPQEAVIMSAKSSAIVRNIKAVQGVFEKQTFISTGGKYYTFNFKHRGYIDLDYIQVKVNNEEWVRESCFYDMVADGKQFVAKPSFIDGVDLIFGNNTHGRSLQNNDIIEVTYLIHDGGGGNLDTTQETFFIFDDTLSDVNGNDIDGNSVFHVSFASNDSVTSGTDADNKAMVREMIGMNSRSLVLTTPEQYKSFIKRFSFCGYNRTWSEKGSLIVNSMILRNFKQDLDNELDYFNMTEKDLLLTENQKSSILNCIENSGVQFGGVSYNIINPIIRKYAMHVCVKLKTPQQDNEHLKTQIRTLIGNFFININSDIFIPKSDIVYLLKDNISNIDSVDVYIISEQNETALITKTYVDTQYKFDPSTGNYITKTENVYLYPGENPNLGLDEHGNIYLKNNLEFPILMGGWNYMNDSNQLVAAQPLSITIKQA